MRPVEHPPHCGVISLPLDPGATTGPRRKRRSSLHCSWMPSGTLTEECVYSSTQTGRLFSLRRLQAKPKEMGDYLFGGVKSQDTQEVKNMERFSFGQAKRRVKVSAYMPLIKRQWTSQLFHTEKRVKMCELIWLKLQCASSRRSSWGGGGGGSQFMKRQVTQSESCQDLSETEDPTL